MFICVWIGVVVVVVFIAGFIAMLQYIFVFLEVRSIFGRRRDIGGLLLLADLRD